MSEILSLNYEAFGAAGDGVRDDMDAIIACHAYANAHGLPVKTVPGRKYYIGGSARFAVIETDTDFGTSEFIIDDRALEDYTRPLFLVSSRHEIFAPALSSLSKTAKKLELGIESPCYVRVFSDEETHFIRKGLNMDHGRDKSDCFLTDEMGNILTDIDYNFNKINKVEARRTDEKAITIQGGVFTTIANQAASFYNYHCRNFEIKRSHVTVKDLKHLVTGETDHGAPYRGFLCAEDCSDITFENCTLTPHFTYWTASRIPGESVPMGTYEITANAVIGLRLKGIRQTIDIMDSRFWGLMGTNFCKDTLLSDCVMSRYDAHMGVTNLTVKNCRLGHMCFNLIGHGNVLVEDTEAFGDAFINLREDYGCNFDGVLTLKNNTWLPRSEKRSVIGAHNTGDHDFGYPCHLTGETVIDGLLIKDGASPEGNVLTIFPNYDPDFEKGKPYPPIPPRKLTVRGLSSEKGAKWLPFEKPEEYEGTGVMSLE